MKNRKAVTLDSAPPPPDAGFARLPLLGMLLLAGLALSACATVSGKTDTPQVVAGKSLLAVQQSIVEARNDIGVPCQRGVIPQDACQKMDGWYQQTKPAYDAAATAEQLALRSTDPALQADAQAKRDTLQSLATQILGLAAQYGIKGGN